MNETPGRLLPNDLWQAINDAANRRRFVALWNACRNLTTADFEAAAAEPDAFRRNGRLREAAARCELAAAWSLADEGGCVELGPESEEERGPALPRDGEGREP